MDEKCYSDNDIIVNYLKSNLRRKKKGKRINLFIVGWDIYVSENYFFFFFSFIPLFLKESLPNTYNMIFSREVYQKENIL